MAYIPLTYSPPEKQTSSRLEFRVSGTGIHLEDDTKPCVCADNLDFVNGGFETRKGFRECADISSCEKEVHSVSKSLFYGRIVVHIGEHLYTFDCEKREVAKLDAVIPDSKSIFCFFMSKLYIYCAYRVFAIDNTFTVKEEYPDAPVMYENCEPLNETGQIQNGGPCNMIAPRISVVYRSSSYHSYRLPLERDESMPFEAYVDDVRFDEQKITFEEDNKIYLTGVDGQKVLRLVYYVKNPKDIAGFDDSFYNNALNCSYGGNANGGTRIFFMGNPDKKGYYYKSGLQNPLCVMSDSYEILGDGCENITAVKEMYGNLIMFTEQSVFRMGYTLTQDGAYFSVKKLTGEMGCDCPGSVKLVDNRVVFANSKKGIFIVDSVGESDEQNIKPIAGNILKGSKGFLSVENEKLKQASAIDFDRKYYFSAGGKIFIWDYDKSPFIDSGNYKKAQDNLIWSIYTVENQGTLFDFAGVLGMFCEAQKKFYDLSDTSSEGVDIRFVSGKTDFGNIYTKKLVTEVSAVMNLSDNADIKLSLYADGEKYYEKKLTCTASGKRHVCFRVPGRKLYEFSFELNGCGFVRTDGFSVKYENLNV